MYAPSIYSEFSRLMSHEQRTRAQVCKRLEVDYAPALVGFEGGRGGVIVPKILGVVVCAEHAEAVRAGTHEEEAARQEKARAKRCAQAIDTIQLQSMGAGLLD